MANRYWSSFSRRAKFAIVAAPVTFIAVSSNANEALPSRGGITEIKITSTQPAFGGARFGNVGAYEILRGKVYGTIDPQAPANSGLSNLNHAPLNAQGLVSYSTDIVILRPVNAAAGNGRIFYEIVNRGAPQSFDILNRGSVTNPGNAFLMNQGYEIVLSGWQPEANPGTATIKANFPVAVDGTQAITKSVVEVYVP